ncbi:GNAT family N-acetyltransferase [Actinoplanes hulinensis]|uniref:GNAT family N-acetyltransferase n=1 Tax=Actinoplanes hulinensis TaxID=1144547 RepID=UPI0027E23E90|nr:GNAT family N-acetyltransferase [Actinoplanes hulinensis]
MSETSTTTLSRLRRVIVRRGNVADALMAAILAKARERGLLHVTVHSGRRAVDFYRRNGFTRHRQILIWESAPPDATMGHA